MQTTGSLIEMTRKMAFLWVVVSPGCCLAMWLPAPACSLSIYYTSNVPLFLYTFLYVEHFVLGNPIRNKEQVSIIPDTVWVPL